MTRSIGHSDILTIGSSDTAFRQASRMRKLAKRTFLDRAKDAYTERFKEKATQAKLAVLVGKKQPSVQEWGLQGRFPEMGTVVELAEKLSVSVEWLLTERGPRYVPPVDKDAQALWKLWPRLEDLDRARVVAYAETRLDDSGGGSGSAAGTSL